MIDGACYHKSEDLSELLYYGIPIIHSTHFEEQ